jgi:hypothetical protein
MSTREQKFISAMIVSLFFIFGLFVWRQLRAEDVYNFYFQKGSGPQTVVQGGSGQSATKAPISAEGLTEPLPASVAVPAATPVAAPVAANPAPVAAVPAESRDRENSFSVTLGYENFRDAQGFGKGYDVGFRVAMTRALGLRLMGRFREPNEQPSYFGGLAALELVPLRLKLFDHPFLNLGVFAGAENVRTASGKGIVPVAGISALFSLNSNFGIEALAMRSIDGHSVAGSLAFQF